MDPHRLAERRSLAYHRVVASRLCDDPAVLDLARGRVHAWRERGVMPYYAARWEALLAGPIDALCGAMLAEDEEGNALRQATPFAGVVDARERWSIWAQVRDEMAAGR